MKKKKKDKKQRTKRLPKTQRIPRRKKGPFRIVVRDWGIHMEKHKEIELNTDSKLEIHIDGCLYDVSINKKNRCLQFDTHETHLYLQPTSIHSFLIKANSKK